MIIKRSLKSKMPTLKRNSTSGADGESSSGSRKKRKGINGSKYPLSLIGSIASSVISGSNGIVGAEKGLVGSSSTEVSGSVGEVVSKLGAREALGEKSGGKGAGEGARPALVRTSRGRVQALPSRFKDSVLVDWKKDVAEENNFDDDDLIILGEKEKSGIKRPSLSGRSRRNQEKGGFKYRKHAALCEDDEGDGPRYLRYKKYLTSPRTMTSIREGFEEDEMSPVWEYEEEGDCKRSGGERNDGLFGPEDFYAGDIVWARSAKSDPVWPAFVIDPMTQAPEEVLRACIPEAACVIFFGHSVKETQRV